MVYCYETFGHKELKYKYFVKLNYLFFFCYELNTFTILGKNLQN